MNEAYFAMRILADEENRKKLLIIILIPILFFIVAMLAASDMGTTAGTAASPLSDQVEKWRPMVSQYCTKYKIPDYVDLALALMQAESSGSEPDPMQAAEGAYGLYCLKTKNNNGGHSHSPNGIPTGHGECSINAGVQELRDALKKQMLKVLMILIILKLQSKGIIMAWIGGYHG